MAVILPRGTQPDAQPGKMTAMNLLYAVVLEPDARPSGRAARLFIRLRCTRTDTRPSAWSARWSLRPHCTRRKKKPDRKLTLFLRMAGAGSPNWKSPLPGVRGTRIPFFPGKTTTFRPGKQRPQAVRSSLLPQDRAGLMKPRWPQKMYYPPPKRRKTGKASETRLFFGKKGQSPGKAPLRLLHGGAVWIKQHLHITPAYCGPRSK